MDRTPFLRRWLWISRLLIGIVLFFNLQAAGVFILAPGLFLTGFGLSGLVGEAIIAGFGVLFLMWNVPYTLACCHPIRFRVSLVEAVCMQGIGVLGETIILIGLPAGNPAGYPGPASVITRFIIFDAMGLALLSAALWISLHHSSVQNQTRKTASVITP
jgi:hypothetical protein